jgi:hypothetical protein
MLRGGDDVAVVGRVAAAMAAVAVARRAAAGVRLCHWCVGWAWWSVVGALASEGLVEGRVVGVRGGILVGEVNGEWVVSGGLVGWWVMGWGINVVYQGEIK